MTKKRKIGILISLILYLPFVWSILAIFYGAFSYSFTGTATYPLTETFDRTMVLFIGGGFLFVAVFALNYPKLKGVKENGLS